jgi:hypothetical protein
MEEIEVVTLLANQLRSKLPWVTRHRKPSTSTKLKSDLSGQLGYVPLLQPEIDLCFELPDGRICAVEVKVFPAREVGPSLPYYAGIGQALALHRYGFDFAALWFVFVGPSMTADMSRYGAQAWHLLRNEFALPLDFTYLRVDAADQEHRFWVQQYDSDRGGHELCPIDDPRFLITFKHPNPLLHTPAAIAIRQVLFPWLKLMSASDGAG